jgi:hypothetical protein
MATKFDAQLHVLRSVAHSLEDLRQRRDAASARNNLFAALAEEDSEAAQNWLEALEVSLRSASPAVDKQSMLAADRSIEAIRKGIR